MSDQESFPCNNPYRVYIDNYPSYIKTRQVINEAGPDHYMETLRQGYSQLIVEIGSGSGNHLIELAMRNPEALVIGFELRFKRIVRTAQKAKKRDLKNLFVFQWNGHQFDRFFQAASLNELYVNFPDPWEKRKHRKRRLFKKNFLSRLHQSLAPGGFFSFKTDHSEYFESFLKVLEEYLESDKNEKHPLQLRELTRDLHQSEWMEENIQTEFEALFIYKVEKKIKHFKVVKSSEEQGTS